MVNSQKVIAVVSYMPQKRAGILKNCLDSIKTDTKVVVVINGGGEKPFLGYPTLFNQENSQEIGALEAVYRGTEAEEIFLLHDTCEIKDNSIWQKVFDDLKGQSVSISTHFLMLIGKYRRQILSQLRFPAVNNKLEGHLLGERDFINHYCQMEEPVVLCPEFHDSKATKEDKWGRPNLKLDCHYMTKWKGNWDVSMITNGGNDAKD